MIIDPHLISLPCAPEDITDTGTLTTYLHSRMVRQTTVHFVIGDCTRVPVVCFELEFHSSIAEIFDFSRALKQLVREDVARKRRVLGR